MTSICQQFLLKFVNEPHSIYEELDSVAWGNYIIEYDPVVWRAFVRADDEKVRKSYYDFPNEEKNRYWTVY